MEIGTPDPPPQPTDTGCPPAHLEIKGEGAAHVLLSPHGRLAHHRPAEVGLGMGGGSGDRITEGGGHTRHRHGELGRTGREHLWGIPLPRSWDTVGSCPLPTQPNLGGVDGGDAEEWGGHSLAALTWSARTGCCSPPATWPARAAGPPGCFACQGTGVSISHHRIAPSQCGAAPPLPAGATGSLSCPSQEPCLLSSSSRISNATRYDPHPPPRFHQAKKKPTSLQAPSSQPISTHPGTLTWTGPATPRPPVYPA